MACRVQPVGDARPCSACVPGLSCEARTQAALMGPGSCLPWVANLFSSSSSFQAHRCSSACRQGDEDRGEARRGGGEEHVARTPHARLTHASCTSHARLMHASCMSCGPPPWPPHCPSPAPSPCVQASPHLSSGDSLERGSARPSFITVTGRLGTFWSLLPGRLPCIWYLFWGVSSCRRRISGAPRTGKRAVAVRPPPYMERGMRSIGFKHRRLVAFDFLRS